MEDIKKRAEFSSVSIQIQAVEKLVQDVRKKVPKGSILSAATPECPEPSSLWQYSTVSQHAMARHACKKWAELVAQGLAEFPYVIMMVCPELSSLWQYSTVPQHAVARRACQKWAELVTQGHAEFTYVTNGLLNQVPTARNLQGVVEAVSQLLMLQVLVKDKAGDQYVCPYTIRSPPHPFVTIVTNRPADSWPLILEQMIATMSSGQHCIRENALAMLDPVLKFVLLDPKSSDHHAALRAAIKTRLVAHVTQTRDQALRKQLFGYLLDIMSKQQVASFQTVAESSQFCLQLLHVYTAQLEHLDVGQGRRLCGHALALCLRSQQSGLDFESLAKSLLAIAKQESKVLATATSLATLSHLLLESYPSDSVLLLDLVRTILKSSDAEQLSPVTVGFVAMATINVMATPGDSDDPSSKVKVSLASEVIGLMETCFKREGHQGAQWEDGPSPDQLVPELYDAQTWVHLGNRLSHDHNYLHRWLSNLKLQLPNVKPGVSWSLTNLLVSTLLTTGDTDLARLTTDRLTDLAALNHSKAPALLPVFLYALGRKTCPRLRLHLMEALPKLASHKYAVPAVLRTILSLGQSPKLKPLSVRLLTQLWARQNRCFPHLLKVITEGNGGRGSATMATVTDEITLARAYAVREVCKLRPEQHGGEMLTPLNDILNTCTHEKSGAAAAMAMEALFYICQAEVIDIMSVWKVLERNLVAETRVPVVEKICKLLSLVPNLQVKTEEYEVFLCEMVRRLWLYTQTDCVAVVTAAYNALACYNMEHFKISHFQFKVVEEFVSQGQAILAQEGNEGLTLDTVMPFVPGVTYTRLMNLVDDAALDGYEAFLSSMVGKEVASLPRGIYRTSLRQHGVSANQGKAIGTIPRFIQTSYEKTKLPGLRPALAAGLLFCYDPPVEVGRDGRPRRHYVITHGRNYQQMLGTLLHDIPVQPSEWHRTMLMPQAWATFMDRLFSSMLEARSGEIDLQLKRDFVTELEADDMKVAAWLWVRDTVVDIIKKATTGNPSIQGNAILALAGLTTAVQRLVTGLDTEERRQADDVPAHLSHAHWLTTVIDSCMSLVDNEFRPRSTALLGLCQQRAVNDRLPASVLAQATAMLALCQMAPVIVSNYTEMAYTLLKLLSQRLPGRPRSADVPQVLHVFHGLALGTLIAKLVRESFPDLQGSKGSLAVMSALDDLEECCFSASEHRSGAVLGLGIGLAGLCRDGKVESRVHVAVVHGKLSDMLQATPPTDTVYQPLCYALATVTGTGFVSNALDIDKVNSTLDLFISLHGNSRENQGVTLSLGMLCHSLSLGSHPNIDAHKQRLHAQWLELVNKGDNPAMERLAALAGLLALVGSENSVQGIDADFSAISGDLKIDKVIAQACQVVTAGDHIGIQGSTAWLLGNLYMSLCTTNTSSSTVPTTYQYLQESSVLRYVLDFLIHAGKQGPELVPSRHVKICLSALQAEVTGALPPLNWTGVISPLMKLPFSERVQLLCVKLSVRLCTSSATAAMFLSSWIVPPLFNTLPECCHAVIFESGSQLIKAVTPAVLQAFYNKSCTEVWLRQHGSHGDQGRSLRRAVIRGVNSALTVKDPPEAVVAMLYKFVREMFDYMREETDPQLLCGMSECLSHLPDAVFDELTSGDCVDATTVVRGVFIRGYLVAHGNQPIALLNSCIDAAFNITCERPTVLYLLAHAFSHMTTVESKTTRVMARAQWLLEILGHVRNITTGTMQLTDPDADLQKVTSFALDIISAAVCAWISPESVIAMALTSDLFKVANNDLEGGGGGSLPSVTGSEEVVSVVDQLRSHIQLLDRDPWNQLVPKVLDWLLAMRELPESVLTCSKQNFLNSCLTSFRHSPDFAKASVWTKAVMC